MTKAHQWVVTEAERGQRLDQHAHGHLPDRSRAFCQKLIADGSLLLNDRPAKPSHRIRSGDRITVTIPPARRPEAQPEPIPLEVLHEDDHLIVVNKPAGLVVHPAAGNPAGTLVNALLHHCAGRLAGIGGVERPGIVHRLDKGTSGCLVVAKSDAAHRGLVAQFKARTVTKIYRAVCQGTLARPSGRIETLIGRSERHRKKMSATVRRGRMARTDYRLLAQRPECALVELTLHTGRTHQIRVHLAHLGHPVVGDPLYGSRAGKFEISNLRSQIPATRPLLHAHRLGFTHPCTGAPLAFTAPMPEEFRVLFPAVVD